MGTWHSAEKKAEIISFRGLLSASEVGKSFGLSRNAVIGIWGRSCPKPISPDDLRVIQSRSQRHVWLRRQELQF